MGSCQVHNVDVVPNTGAVLGGIIVPVNLQGFRGGLTAALPVCGGSLSYPQNSGNKMGLWVVVLAEVILPVGPSCVEVPQAYRS